MLYVVTLTQTEDTSLVLTINAHGQIVKSPFSSVLFVAWIVWLQTPEVFANSKLNAYFGDLHVHTRYSFDAYIFGTRAGPDEAYRFAKGQPIQHVGGFEIQLERPLDFYAVTDHAFFLGMLDAMESPQHPLHKHRMARKMRSELPNRRRDTSAFAPYFIYLRLHNRPQDAESAWAKTIDVANRHYEPGKFTTFIGYEYTANYTISRGGIHRNVIYKGDTAPSLPFSRIQSRNPERLWEWMEEQRKLGHDSIAIPHNSNASDGRMFETKTRRGRRIDPAYASLRSRNEPLVEISQIKGTSETHPELSPNDEWAGFELTTYQVGNNRQSKLKGSYLREAWLNGIRFQSTLGINPYDFGAIAGSDTHNAGELFDEQRYVGSRSHLNDLPSERGSVPPSDPSQRPEPYEKKEILASSAGLAGVWAEENTREAIFKSLRNKETFATSGSRIKLRFLAGYELTDAILESVDAFDNAYELNKTMGSTMQTKVEEDPTFFVWALQDPKRNKLDRIQIIKGWLDSDGQQHEKVFDVVCAGDREMDVNSSRCVGELHTVDIENCAVDDSIGAAELKALWHDPNFQADQFAFYYVRVLETHSCRWSTWDAIRSGVEPNPKVPATIQERAWSSPIWVYPEL